MTTRFNDDEIDVDFQERDFLTARAALSRHDRSYDTDYSKPWL